MIRFLYKFCFFFLLVILIIFVLDQFLYSIDSSYKEKINGLKINGKNINILVFGNSHATYGVNPKEFSLNTYNIANVSQSLYFDKRIFLKYVNNLPNLKFCLISLDFHSFYFSSQGDRDIWSFYSHGIKYKEKSYLLPNCSPFLFGYKPRFSSSFIKKYMQNKIFKSKYIRNNCLDIENGVDVSSEIYNGFAPFVNTTSLSVNEMSNRAKAFNNLAESNYNESYEISNDLKDFILILKKRNIYPILFTTPTHINFNKYLSKKIIENNNKIINEITNKYNIHYWNFFDDKTFVSEDFYNCDHLNSKGASKFSKILNNKLKSLPEYQ